MAKRKKAVNYAKGFVKIGKAIASEAKQTVAKELKHVVGKRLPSEKEARILVRELVKELRVEGERVAAFARREFEREARKARPLVKKAIKRVAKGK